jgi:hypothetical protein
VDEGWDLVLVLEDSNLAGPRPIEQGVEREEDVVKTRYALTTVMSSLPKSPPGPQPTGLAAW